jgi:hypothetical protein
MKAGSMFPVGLDPAAYAGHSLRAGFAISANCADIPLHRIAGIAYTRPWHPVYGRGGRGGNEHLCRDE